jgi:hypothetical protein
LTLAERRDLLLGRIDALRPAMVLGGLDAARQLGEISRQIGIADQVVGELGPAADDRPLGAVRAAPRRPPPPGP